MVDREIVWSAGLNAAQWQLLTCDVFEIFFGGARGGGKTDAMLGEWVQHASRYNKHAIGLMLRRTRTELIETIQRSQQIYGPLGWHYNIVDKMWSASNGARLRFGYLERDADADQYQGHSLTRLYIEEIGNFPTPAPIFKLMATLRSGARVPVGFRATGNPGGPGHAWVKARYVDPAPLGNEVITDQLSGLERIYIPSRVDNNQYIDVEAYKQRLKASGSPELVRAWLDGDWNVALGAYFDEWSTDKHVVPPFPIPPDWTRFRSADWGSASPFCIQWWAIVQDDFVVPGTTKILPRGCIVQYREMYGMKEGQPNVGVKMSANLLGAAIQAAEAKDGPIAFATLDPSAFAEDGGPSIAERIALGSDNKVYFRRADNTRVGRHGAMGGWDVMRSRLVGDADGRPMLVVFSTCKHFIRTVPVLQHDPDHPEDVMTESEDHAADACRYACTSRPYVQTIEPPKPEDISGYKRMDRRDNVQPLDWKSF